MSCCSVTKAQQFNGKSDIVTGAEHFTGQSDIVVGGMSTCEIISFVNESTVFFQRVKLVSVELLRVGESLVRMNTYGNANASL